MGARGVDAEVAGAAMIGSSQATKHREWQVRQGHGCEVGTASQVFMITFVGLVKAAHCIGFEIILQSS